jgi:hypothetical protein
MEKKGRQKNYQEDSCIDNTKATWPTEQQHKFRTMEEEFLYEALRDPADVIDAPEENKKEHRGEDIKGVCAASMSTNFWGAAHRHLQRWQ